MIQGLVHHSSTGLRDIDAANEGLCWLIDRVFAPMVECRRLHGPCDHTACAKIGAVVRYCQRNFSAQEAVMQDHGFPSATDHAGDHRRLIDELEALRRARTCGDRDRVRVKDLLNRWTAGHIIGRDRKLGEWLTDQD